MSGIVSDNKSRSSGLIKSGVTDYDDNKLQANIALLGFKAAVNGSLAKYNLQDQMIDEYEDASGVDAGASTNESLESGAYKGGGSGTQPTGGNTSSAGGYHYHYFLIGDTGEDFVIQTPTTVEFLLVGGGGQGGSGTAGGGGAGGGHTGAGYLVATDGGGSAGGHSGYNVATTALNTAETPTSPFSASGGDITTGGVTYSGVAFGNNGGIQYQSGNGGAPGGGGAGGVGANGIAYDEAGGGNGGARKAIASINHT